jgi:protein gp37
MNSTKIEWTDATINPVTGCVHRCDYCYARRQAKRRKHKCQLCYDFIPHPHLERLEQLKKSQKAKKIFIDSMWDWNSKGVEEDWLFPIIAKMSECSQHTFQILTKRPEGFSRFIFPENVWLGTSITSSNDMNRVHQLKQSNNDNIRFVSMEPLLGPIDMWLDELDWIIIGAETGHRKGKIVPHSSWIKRIIQNAKTENISIFIKNNLEWPIAIKEFPNIRNTD